LEEHMPTCYNNGYCNLAKTNCSLGQATAKFMDWPAITFPPWLVFLVDTHARMTDGSARQVPRILCPIGIGEFWWYLAAKATLLAAGRYAKELCNIDQLYAGLEAGILKVVFKPLMSSGGNMRRKKSGDFC
jgi:hypothetical protein